VTAVPSSFGLWEELKGGSGVVQGGSLLEWHGTGEWGGLTVFLVMAATTPVDSEECIGYGLRRGGGGRGSQRRLVGGERERQPPIGAGLSGSLKHRGGGGRWSAWRCWGKGEGEGGGMGTMMAQCAIKRGRGVPRQARWRGGARLGVPGGGGGGGVRTGDSGAALGRQRPGHGAHERRWTTLGNTLKHGGRVMLTGGVERHSTGQPGQTRVKTV
jgi:hypothetical protein